MPHTNDEPSPKIVDETTPVGFIGLGVMGRSMANRLLQAGFRLHVHTRTRSKASLLLDKGAAWEKDNAAVAAASRAVITMLGFPEDVEAVYFGPGGLLETAAPGTLLIDMTTTAPSLSRRIFEAAESRGLRALDAPVSGGDVGAREGTLSIMVGGAAADFQAALPLFRAMGRRYVHQGVPGSGQRAKLANQIAVFGSTLGTCEAMAFSVRAGLDPERVLESISAGAAASWSLTNLAPRVLLGDFAPGFFVRHMLKDIRLAREEARSLGLPSPALTLAEDLYGRLVAEGRGDKGTQALYLLLNPGVGAGP
ncbi:MAG TPA: NAD(P)-dependent oxidoreductase [Fibrobacteria bacterium]|nr:NAD(P)-dependent oxidoreductase [Fibrobacteria bacterium]